MAQLRLNYMHTSKEMACHPGP